MAGVPTRKRARPRCKPVLPARMRNDRHWQVSWLPDYHAALAFPDFSSGMWERHSPVTVAGAASGQGSKTLPNSLLGLFAQTTDGVGRPLRYKCERRKRGRRNGFAQRRRGRRSGGFRAETRRRGGAAKEPSCAAKPLSNSKLAVRVDGKELDGPSAESDSSSAPPRLHVSARNTLPKILCASAPLREPFPSLLPID